jgi:glycyl-tRNA synthetase beta chain
LRRAALGTLRLILENRLRINLLESGLSDDLLEFFVDRLKVVLRTREIGHDVVTAVFSISKDGDFVRRVDLVEALQSFLKSDDGANLLVAYRRAANILKAEEKKDKTSYDGTPEAKLLVAAEEKALGKALTKGEPQIAKDIAAERFVEAMGVMAKLRPPVDAFFDKVIVNAPEPELRRNRLLLLSRLRATLHLVADFSKIEG